MGTAIYLAVLFLFLTSGMASARWVIPIRWKRGADRILTLCLYLLLFFMGVKTGLIENIETKLAQIGLLALLVAGFTAAGSTITVILVRRLVVAITKAERSDPPSEGPSLELGKRVMSFLEHMRDPARLLLCVVSGAFLAAATPLFAWYSDTITEYLLYLLLFFVGVQMVQDETDIISVLKDPVSLILPLCTIVGTIGASFLVGLITDLTRAEALALGAGFGWYSLSGVLISELGDPLLGSVAFLSNLFRESIAFIAIPLLAGYGQRHAGISVGGATSMDVTLPMVEKSCGTEYVPISIAHGVILTLIVPFLVPFFYTSL